MHNKPLRLDLSNFFTDERKCSLILLDVSWKNIKNLQDHIQNLFHLNGISLLDRDGSYLPPKESIEVLRDTYALKVFKFQNPIKEDLSNKENTLEIAVTEQESPLVSTQNLKADLSNKDGVIDPPIPRCPEVVLRCALLEIRLDTPRVFKLPRQESPVKILENIIIPPRPLATMELKDIEPIRDAAKKSETEDQTPDLETSTESQINKIESTEKEEEAIEEVNTANVVKCNSDSEDDDVMVLEDSDSDVQPVAPVVGSRKSETTDVISDLLQYGVKLNNLPSKGDTIVFKLPKVKGCPKSGQTEFLAGTCCYVNRRTKIITINVISYPKHLVNLLRQYKSNLDESEVDVPVLNVNISDLIEASICVATVD
ncbi:coilin-like [Drosophila tropicalis]|uniref:coilin-like n=1 Tax=Drosophila tropicalis TaxID=46794 RepID=UPI0035ABF74C